MKSLRRHLPTLAEVKFQTGAIAAFGVGYLGSYIAAIINPSLLAETSLDEPAVGMLGSIELLLLAFFSLVLAPFAARVSYRGVAIGGVAAAAFGYGMSAQSFGFEAMATARVIMGIGAGVAVVAVNAAVASSDDPDRRFAMIYTVGGILAATFVWGIPFALVPWGYQGGFAVCVLLCLVALPFCAWLPRRAEEIPESTTRPPQILPSDGPPSALAVLLVIGAIAIYSVGEQALWAFAGEIGMRNVGVPVESVGRVLAGMTLAGSLGGFLAWRLGARFGRARPILIASLASSLSRFGFMLAEEYALMVVAAVLWGFSYYFITPFQMGVAAAMDRRGRVAVAAGAMMNFGYAFGPGIGGAVLGYLGQQVLLVVIVACVVIPLLMLLPVAAAQDQSARALLDELAPDETDEPAESPPERSSSGD